MQSNWLAIGNHLRRASVPVLGMRRGGPLCSPGFYIITTYLHWKTYMCKYVLTLTYTSKAMFPKKVVFELKAILCLTTSNGPTGSANHSASHVSPTSCDMFKGV